MRPEITALFRELSPKAGACVADGYGIRIFVRRGHLIVEDGIGRFRRERTFARATAEIKRLVVHGHEGFLTFEALRWMADLGIAFIQIDRDGKLIAATGPQGNDDGRLRRAQALANDSELGLQVSRWILDLKLQGQGRLLAQLGAQEAQKAIAAARRGLEQFHSTNALMSTPEARAAAAYWEAWASLPIEFVRKDQGRVPEHWKTFGPRRSAISGSPRLAINPANAILNYLYRLVEAETRLACLTVGLDPGLGFFHKDKRGRDNLVMDLMEAVRPKVDAYALRLFKTQVLRAADFHETRKGVCRVLAPLSHQLAETTMIWTRAAVPVAEGVARMLGKPRRIRADRRPITGTNRSTVRAGVLDKPDPLADIPSQGRIRACRECGHVLESRLRQFCDDGLRSAGEDDSRALKGAAVMVRQQEALAEWRSTGVARKDDGAFRLEILPHLRAIPVRKIMSVTGLSEAYCYRIRRGEVVPHPRHWRGLKELVASLSNTSMTGQP